MSLKTLVSDIDSIDIGFDIKKLKQKIELINKGLSIVELNQSDEFAKELLLRVYYLGFEIGSSKAFESNFGDHKSLVVKALPIARIVFGNTNGLLPFLKDGLFYETVPEEKEKLQNELQSIATP
jgi:hypothetical protein